MLVGPAEVEPEIQTFDSEDVNDPTTEKLPKVTEEKPERSKDSTIHTARQFLMDARQVCYPVCCLTTTVAETALFYLTCVNDCKYYRTFVILSWMSHNNIIIA